MPNSDTRPQFAPRRHRAQLRVTEWQRAHPWRRDYWKAVDDVRAAHGHEWPRYCFLPVEAAGAIVVDAWRRAGRTPTPATIIQEVSELATYAAWRMGQGIYRFDPTLYAALSATQITGDLPADALRRLPEWCVYVETPGRLVDTTTNPTPLHGMYAWIDCPKDDDTDILTLGLDTDLPLTLTHVPLVGPLDAAIARTIAEWEEAYERGNATRGPRAGFREAAQQTLPPLLALLLYLCADKAEIGDGTTRPTRPLPQKTKRGWRLFPADSPTTWDVGLRIGAALRQAEAEARTPEEGWPVGARRGPRPHIRRAHWHTYWTGPRRGERAGEQQRRLRWIPPLPINVDGADDLPAVIHEVE